ncbi:MAG TPA: helix-hairpin-helix domain-containing protein, partial [Oligoflexia bacterium]|nr:helix-hairpin-helix domain-containing protein [Oligoflexia bacterium]
MDKSDVASALAQAAVLLELKGENQFKVRAFHAAADRVLDYAGSLETFAAELEAGKLKGFGTQLAGHALEVCRTGKLSLLDELVAAFPQGVLEMLEVPGLGVKKVKSLYDGLSVSSIDELRNACLSGEVAKLKGFGEKSQQKILQALELKQTYRGKLRLDAAGRLAAEVMQALLAESVCQR